MTSPSNILIYNGENLADFGGYIFGEGAWKRPSPDIDFVSVPGRNGDVPFFNGSYSNVSLTYNVIVMNHLDEIYGHYMSFLYNNIGYARLEDGDHPNVFRMAVFDSSTTSIVKNGNDSGRFEIEFSAKPQQWLKIGEIVQTLSQSGRIFNPTPFASKPFVRVYGTGALGIGDQIVTITQADQYTDIDFESEEAYKGSVNCNANIELSGYNFPSIPSGAVNISLGNGITRVEITPRWWTI